MRLACGSWQFRPRSCTIAQLFLSIAVAVLLTNEACAQNVSFLPQGEIPIGPGCCVIVSGDFNGDGKLDLAVGYGSGTLALLLGDGTGGFKLPMTVVTTLRARVYSLFAVDVNRDGKLDLVTGIDEFGTPETYVLLGRGDGTFQLTPQPVASGIPIFAADLNNDGIPDLALSNLLVACDLEIRLGNGDGTFQKPQCLESNEHMSDEVAIGDFNGDGIPDLVWSSGRSNGNIHLFLGNGDGTFRQGSEFGEHAPSVERKPLAVGDLNRDGKLDVVAGANDFIEVFLGNGDGTVQEGITIPVLHANDTVANLDHDVFVADLNSDGKLDIVRGSTVILGNGDGTFQPPQYLLEASIEASSQVCADLNRDHLPDLVYVDYDSGLNPTATALSVLLNNSPGQPTSVVAYSAATGTHPVAPSSIASIYGKDLARSTAEVNGPTLPTQLGGISLRVRDRTHTVSLAPLLYVSPTQINFLVPDQTSPGPAVLTVDDGSPLVETANASPVMQIAPGIFAADGQGQGPAAATAVRILSDGTQQPVTVFNCTGPGHCNMVPIDLTGGRAVYLTLYGTGIRNAAIPQSLLSQNVRCTIGGVSAALQYLGAQPTIPGLDQINLLVPPTLASGTASVQCLIYGNIATNPVQIEIK